MGISLTVSSDDYSQREIDDITRAIRTSLLREGGIGAEPVEHPSESGTRGGDIEVGKLLLTFFSSGAAAALCGVLKAYLDRAPAKKLGITLDREDGATFVISAENLETAEFNHTISLAEKFLEAG